jgi:hypothetical protein
MNLLRGIGQKATLPNGPERTKRANLTDKPTKQERQAALRKGSGVARSGLNPSVFSDALCCTPQT